MVGEVEASLQVLSAALLSPGPGGSGLTPGLCVTKSLSFPPLSLPGLGGISQEGLALHGRPGSGATTPFLVP